ncbi:hypothetical protein F5Y09DRAFT_311320 [Xylaria sp. FL1042]|nr:hypothetical protein F5Y09DRAFT_311320 [Xylaria sp. FL1042]
MAFRWLDLFNNPHRLATALLGVSVCFLSLHMLPPSSATYFWRVEYIRNSTDAVTSTIWFSSLGYCKSHANNNALNHSLSTTQCSGTMFGYDIKSALELDGMDISLAGEENWYKVFTMGFITLNTVSIALSLMSVAAHQSVLRKPTMQAYTSYMMCSIAAMLYAFMASFCKLTSLPYIMRAYPPAGVTFTTAEGPVHWLWAAAVCLQTLACTVGFYGYIGGKYKCEGYNRLEDEEASESGGDTHETMTSHYSSLEEKCPHLG